MPKTPPAEPEETLTTDQVTADLPSVHSAVSKGAATPSIRTNVEDAPVARGATIGRYVVLQEVGRGGMGVVYAAYDAELDRKVAIKVLRGSSGNAARDHDRQARLLREAQAMARIDHPNVLSVYDVGTIRGQIFVAMAFVDGTTLSGWIRDRRHTWQQTLQVFLSAGQGLAAAHAVGLVHRDFKPANVLIAKDARVFVTDFGLARLMGNEEEGSPLPSAVEVRRGVEAAVGLAAEMTRDGAVLGTPTYMAPEQHAGQQADARSDQFAFCAALYWALWHKRPFDPSMLAAAAFRRFGGASTVPQRVKGAGDALDDAAVIAEPPRELRIPARIRRAVMKGLSLDPAERFDSMESLLKQLSLERRQTQARWAAAAGALALAVTATGLAWQRAARQRAELCSGAPARLRGTWDDAVAAQMTSAFVKVAGDRGALEAERVTRALADYAERWSEGYRDACEATRVRGEQSDQMLSLRMLCLDRRLKELDALTNLFQAPDQALVERAAEASASLSGVRQCQELEALHLLGRPDDPGRSRALEQVEAKLSQIRALKLAGRYRAALPLAREALGAAVPLSYRPAEAEARMLLGWLAGKLGDKQTGEKELAESFYVAEAGHDDYTKTQAAVWLVHQLRDQREKALEWARHARAGLQRMGDNPDLEVDLLNDIGVVHLQAAHYAEALGLLQQGLAVAERATNKDMHRIPLLANLGAAYLRLGDREKAVATMRDALEVMRATHGPEHPVQLATLRNLAFLLAQQGDLRSGFEYMGRAVALARKSFGPESPQLAEMLDTEGDMLLLDHRPAEALERFQTATAIQTKALGPEAADLGYSLDGVGQALAAMGRPKEAVPQLEKACRLLATDPEQLAETQFHLAKVLVAAREGVPRARGLAQQARSGFLAANVPDKAQEVTRWLAQTGR